MGDAKEIWEKYKKKDPKDKTEGFGFDQSTVAKWKGKTVFSSGIYWFDNCISECFEPYL